MTGVAVFLCNCQDEMADMVDLQRLGEELDNDPDVVELVEHAELCSAAGVDLLTETVSRRELDGVLVCACSQGLFDVTFRPLFDRLPEEKALNLDLRTCALPGSDATTRTGEVLSKAAALLRWLAPAPQEEEPEEGQLETRPTDEPHEFVKRALVIGGGIAGIQAALDIANSGYEVVLVEREPSIGGHMIQLSETFPSLDCSQCILTPKMADAGRHPRIRLITLAEVTGIRGQLGRFTARIRRKPRYVRETCTACGDCAAVCPALVTDQFNTGLRWRKAIYQPFPQAVPSLYTLDPETCLGLFPLACGKCEQACDRGCIDYDMQPTEEEVEVGAVVMATGYDLYSYGDISEYGYRKYDDVINGFQFERLLSASGPTLGRVVRPSDGAEPKEVVFIQCVRSRNPAHGVPYCSGICCMYTAKHAMLFKHRVPDGQAYVFYMDIRAGGKGYEEFVRRAMETEGVMYLRGRVSRVFREGNRVVVWGVDTLIGKRIEIAADLVVLATAIVPNDGHAELASLTGLAADDYGFFAAAQAKVHPIEAAAHGFYVVGCCQGPMDIPDTVAQASGAAAKICALFAKTPVIGGPSLGTTREEA